MCIATSLLAFCVLMPMNKCGKIFRNLCIDRSLLLKFCGSTFSGAAHKQMIQIIIIEKLCVVLAGKGFFPQIHLRGGNLIVPSAVQEKQRFIHLFDFF